MVIAEDSARSLREAADIVNSMPMVGGEELLGNEKAVTELIQRYKMSFSGRITEKMIGRLHTVRSAVADVFGATQEDIGDSVNRLLELATFSPRLRSHDNLGWHVHYFDESADLPERIAADIGMAFALLVVANEEARLKTCSAIECSRVFLDETKNRSRKYCDSFTCGNITHVRRYRGRHVARQGAT